MRRSPLVLGCVLGAALGLLAAPTAAMATKLTITSIIVTEKVLSNGQFVKRGQVSPGNVFVTIGVKADDDCQTWIIRNGPNTTGPFPGQAVPIDSAKRWAGFQLKVPLHPPNIPTGDFRTEDFYAHATCGIFDNPDSPIEKAVITTRKVPDLSDLAPPQEEVPAANEKANTAQKNAGAGTKTDGGAPHRARLSTVPAGAAGVFNAFAARELMAAVALAGVETLPAAAGPRGARVTVAAPPALPVLSAAFSVAARADVETALRNLGDQIVVGQAAVDALSRREDAIAAGDAGARATQTAHAADLLERWAGLLGNAAALRQAAQTAIAATFPLTPGAFTQADVDSIVAAAAGDGILPGGLDAALTAAGAGAEARFVARGRMRSLSLSAVNGYTPTLVSTNQKNSEATAALSLRRLSTQLRTGKPTGTAPAPGLREAKGLGELRRVGCISASETGCGKARAMEGAKYVASSPDGRFVYVTAPKSGAITAFARQAASGRLKQLAGKLGCYSATLPGCTKLPVSTDPQGIIASADGKHVYVALYGGAAVVSLGRNRKTGALRWLGCVGDTAPCTKGPGKTMGGSKVLALSPDGRTLYTGSLNGASVVALTRDPRSGRLRSLACYGRADYGCEATVGIGGVAGVSVSLDGQWVYATDNAQGTVLAFRRDRATGRLTAEGCVSGRDGVSSFPTCANGIGISAPEWNTSAPDGSVWVGSSSAGAVVRMARDASGALGMATVSGACTVDTASGTATGGFAGLCTGQPGLSGAYGVALSPNGSLAYVGAYTPGAVSAFRVEPADGSLVGVGPCFGAVGSGCSTAPGLKRAGHVALTPDGRQLLVMAPESSAISVFERRLRPELPTPARSSIRLVKGRLTVRASCPATAQSACFGSWQAQIYAGKRRKLRTKAASFSIAPGGKARFVVGGAGTALRGVGSKVKLSLVVKLTAREPFRAKAASAAKISVRRR